MTHCIRDDLITEGRLGIANYQVGTRMWKVCIPKHICCLFLNNFKICSPNNWSVENIVDVSLTVQRTEVDLQEIADQLYLSCFMDATWRRDTQ